MLIDRLRDARKNRGLTLKQVADKIGASPQQIQRLETGQRRMTVDMLEAVCSAIGVDPVALMRSGKRVPLLGVLDAYGFVKPLPPNSDVTAPAPYLGVDPEMLGALRWEPSARISWMNGHHVYFRRDIDGIDPKAWQQRAIIRLEDDTQRMGWLIREGGQVHINDVSGNSDFNVDITWASKVLGVLPPDEEW